MANDDLLAERFERVRPRLRAVAYRMLGSITEAEDAVQEAWLRLQRTDDREIGNLAAWLTTVVGRVCLDMLRSRTQRREEPLDLDAEPPAAGADPEQQAMLADSVGLALLVVLDTLAPTERLAFVLHDLFAVSFDEIAVMVGRSPAAARQLASRARRRIQAASDNPDAPDADATRGRAIVDAFLTASRGGDMAGLLELLDPDVVLRADLAAARLGSEGETRGAEVVARFFSGRAQAAVPALIDGVPAAVVLRENRIFIALTFIVTGGRIAAIESIADPDDLAALDVRLSDR
ncbi:sigma-70 family RNA polymerase sigma factor [Dactylosporangium sp. AC04546]|uniref:sigma-70 family RNA polymerase sigma factor n=1 Tax=Dactylosporangium sp. AC04546 TaxID=2862460 RepID=UPI001EE14ABF|nr:sigma-70 family RNA polymerase sigma factor [Dactylosporangium sp. AC04546]WVK88041.1 sigma-70 family RNA polymerase sigma factor [Dactylosporangium sp. AC04546]